MSETTEQGLSIPQWTLADRLRKSLEHAGIAPTEMAQYLEVHRNTISNWIYGHARPPASAVKLWAMRCGVPYDWLNGAPPSDHQRSHWCAERAPGTVELATSPLRKPIDTDAELRAALRRRIPVSRDLTGRE